MPDKYPFNPSHARQSSVRWFDGIGGPALQVLSRRNDKGWDISNSVANEIVDLDLRERGTLRLRPGMARLSSSFQHSVTAVFGVRMGGRRRYGMVSDGSLTIVDLPNVGGIVAS